MAHELHWFETRPKFIILKVDVEGFEPPVIRGARQLLRSGLVENILMEATGQTNNTETVEMIHIVMQAGFRYYFKCNPLN